MIDRRNVLLSAAGFGAAVCALTGAGRASAASGISREKLVEDWMKRWIESGKVPVGALHVSRFVEPVYFLLRPITWKPNRGQEAYPSVTVPRGFVTDFASIPSIFFSILRADGEYTYAAIIHDYLYWTQTTKRSTADAILKFAMEDFKVGWGARTVIYNSVWLGGGSAWNENKRAKDSGERRVLKVLPTDPTTRWSDYKKDPGVFM